MKWNEGKGREYSISVKHLHKAHSSSQAKDIALSRRRRRFKSGMGHLTKGEQMADSTDGAGKEVIDFDRIVKEVARSIKRKAQGLDKPKLVKRKRYV